MYCYEDDIPLDTGFPFIPLSGFEQVFESSI